MHFVQVSKVWTCTDLLALQVHTIFVEVLRSAVRQRSMTASGLRAAIPYALTSLNSLRTSPSYTNGEAFRC